MATVENEKDVILQAAGSRIITVSLPANVDVGYNELTGTKPPQNATATAFNYCHPRYSVFADIDLPPTSDVSGLSTHDDTVGLFGGKSIMISSTSANCYASMGASSTDYNLSIANNKKWIISAYVRADIASKDAGFILKTSNAGASYYPALISTSATPLEWVRISAVIDLTLDSSKEALIFLRNYEIGVDMWFDGLMVEEQTDTAVSDPSPFVMPAFENVRKAFNYCHPRYSIFNETALPPLTVGNGTASLDTTESIFSGQSLKLAATAADAYVYCGSTNIDYNITIPANKRWIISGYASCSAASILNDLYVKTSDAAVHHSTNFTTSATINTWERFSGVLDLSADASTTCVLRVDNDGGIGVDMYFDGLMLELQEGGITSPSPFIVPPLGIDSIASDHFSPLSVLEDAIASSAIVTAKLADEAVTTTKIGLLAVGNAQIDNATIQTAKIGDLQILTGKVGDNAITGHVISEETTDQTATPVRPTGTTIPAFAVGTASVIHTLSSVVVAGTSDVMDITFDVRLDMTNYYVRYAITPFYNNAIYFAIRRGASGPVIHEEILDMNVIAGTSNVASNGTLFVPAITVIDDTVAAGTYAYYLYIQPIDMVYQSDTALAMITTVTNSIGRAVVYKK